MATNDIPEVLVEDQSGQGEATGENATEQQGAIGGRVDARSTENASDQESHSQASTNLPPDIEEIMLIVERMKWTKKESQEFIKERLAVRDRWIEKERLKNANMEKEIHRLNNELEKREKQMGSKPMSKNPSSDQNMRSPLSHLKLPVFDEKSTDIEAYIFRFEKHAELCKWPKDIWCQALAARLTGEALDVFRDLSIEKASTYDELKKALFKHFHFTEDGFRDTFRECRPKTGENFQSFTDRMKRHFIRWQNSAEVEKDYEKLKDLILREHVYSVCSKDLVAFLKQEGCKDLTEVTTKAERYRLAHPNKQLCSKVSSSESLFHTGAVQTRSDAKRNDGNRWRDEKTDHRVTERDNDDDASTSQVREDNRTCWFCSAKGHVQRFCKKKKEAEKKFSKPEKRSNLSDEANLCIPVAPCEKCGSDTKLIRECNHDVTKISSAMNVNDCLTTCMGKVNGQKVDVLLDTGCTTVGIHKKFVKSDQITNRKKTCLAFGGEVFTYPIARVSLDCPYFSGEVDACVLERPAYDVILGKIDGCSLQVAEHRNIENAATSRHVKRDKKSTETTRVTETPLLVSQEELIRLQKEDEDLDIERHRASTGEKFLKRRASVHFEIRDDILLRVYTHKRTKRESTQIVVPKTLRHVVMKFAHDTFKSGHRSRSETRRRLMKEYYWRGFCSEINRYCRSCKQCQKRKSFENVGTCLRLPFVMSNDVTRDGQEMEKGQRHLLLHEDLQERKIKGRASGHGQRDLQTSTGWPESRSNDRLRKGDALYLHGSRFFVSPEQPKRRTIRLEQTSRDNSTENDTTGSGGNQRATRQLTEVTTRRIRHDFGSKPQRSEMYLKRKC